MCLCFSTVSCHCWPLPRLHMVTWNVATAEPPEDLTSLLQLDVQPPTDLYVIGWEMASSGKKQQQVFLFRRIGWNCSICREKEEPIWLPVVDCVCLLVPSLGVSLQEVNATPVRFISDLLVEDTWSHVFMDTLAPRGFVKVRNHMHLDVHWNTFNYKTLLGPTLIYILHLIPGLHSTSS